MRLRTIAIIGMGILTSLIVISGCIITGFTILNLSVSSLPQVPQGKIILEDVILSKTMLYKGEPLNATFILRNVDIVDSNYAPVITFHITEKIYLFGLNVLGTVQLNSTILSPNQNSSINLILGPGFRTWALGLNSYSIMFNLLDSESQGIRVDFNVENHPSEHRVLSYVLVDQIFIDQFGSPESYIKDASYYFEQQFEIRIIPVLVDTTWTVPDDHGTVFDLWPLALSDAGVRLNLGRDWQMGLNTSPNNHGFDHILACTGLNSSHLGVAGLRSNFAVVTGGNEIGSISNNTVHRVIQHEISHNYNASDHYNWWDLFNQSVMTKPYGILFSNSWYDSDIRAMNPYVSKFDGIQF